MGRNHEVPLELPPFNTTVASMPEIVTQWHRFEELNADQLYELLRFRQNIFVVEQRSPYPDLDGLDRGAWHLAARAEGDLAGYLRLIPMAGPPLTVRIGRVAVSPSARRRGIGRTLMQQALRFCHERYPTQPIALSAQLHLVAFYQGLGFNTLSEPYEDFGILHVNMLSGGVAAL
jgi:ElaA protein